MLGLILTFHSLQIKAIAWKVYNNKNYMKRVSLKFWYDILWTSTIMEVVIYNLKLLEKSSGDRLFNIDYYVFSKSHM